MTSKKINRILIANRGEIACRVIRTCKRLGIETVAVTSRVDKDLPHARLADFSVIIGEATAKESYLDIDKVVQVAKDYQVDAVHPGYGFLSENADFAEALQKNGIIFIGPNPKAIRAMGSKSEAKAIAEQANVPIIKGYRGEKQDANSLLEEAIKIGFPLLIKAIHGGGGKGMRLVVSETEFTSLLESCQREASSAFGNPTVMLEKYIENPRHIEVQVFGDNHGDVVALAERDCSLQRRHQKVIEEAPALGLSQAVLDNLRKEAVSVAKAVAYQGAGTVEFLVDSKEEFYFLEMNTRLQVEHPVTEEILGLDLVEWQIRIAEGDRLSLSQTDIKPQGHAIEVRLYAEDPDHEFLPSTGKLTTFDISQKCRLDAGYAAGDLVSVFYDPMLAKLIVKAENRKSAINLMQAALIGTKIQGVKTNQKFLLQLLSFSEVNNAYPDIGFIDRLLKSGSLSKVSTEEEILAAALLVWNSCKQVDTSHTLSPWALKDDWRLAGQNGVKISFSINDEAQEILLSSEKGSTAINLAGKILKADSHTLDQHNLTYFYQGNLIKAQYTDLGNGKFILLTDNGVHEITTTNADLYQEDDDAADKQLNAPMPGRVISVLTTVGQQVDSGAPLMILEAMKMEHTIRAPFSGVVESVFFNPGDFVEEGVELARVKAA